MIAKKKVIIVVNDFRAIPYTAALDIYSKFKDKYDCEVIISERFFSNNDYGSVLPKVYKKIKYLLSFLFYKIKLIAVSNDTILLENHFVGLNSSLKSSTLDSSACGIKYPEIYKCLLEMCKGAVEICDYISKQNNIKTVILFNGRGAPQFPISHYCFYNNIKIMYYEFSELSYKYLFSTHAPHASLLIGKNLIKFRRNSIIPLHKLFENGQGWVSRQLSNQYTHNYIEKSNQNFAAVIFLGSDHEYTGLDPKIAGYTFKGNLELVKYAFEKYHRNGKLCVRAHPNQKMDVNYEFILKEIVEYCDSFDVTFYGPESKISSYDLIIKSSVVVVEYSSIAYDAFFLNAKVDIFGDLDLKIMINTESLNSLHKNNSKRFIAETLSLKNELSTLEFNIINKFWVFFFKHFEKRFFNTMKLPK
jgi:hypothetical protein